MAYLLFMHIKPAASSYADESAVIAASGTLSNSEKTYLTTLVNTYKADGTWTEKKGIYVFLGGNANTVGINLKTPGTYNMTFPNGVTVGSYGIALSNTQYGLISASPATALGLSGNTGQEGHFSLAIANDTTNAGGTWNSFNSEEQYFRLNIFRNEFFFSDNMGSMAAGTRILTTDVAYTTVANAYYMGNRSSPTSHRLLLNNVLTASTSNDIAAQNSSIPTANIYLNANGGSAEFQTGKYYYADFGLGLTTAQETTSYNGQAAFRTSIGGRGL
jgi:hypothetical protein